ncbi:MAG: hypothetical protein Q4A32_01260 [Lachnospiraceae bacterium]|nr:hypothetical protein [Lachnospiraceae bacterium]
MRNVSDTSKYKEFKKVYNEAYKIYLPKPIRMYSDTPSDDISEAVTIHSSIGTKEDNEHQGFELTDSSRVLSS